MSRVENVIKNIRSNITGKSILEVACGCAEFSIAASKTADNVTGIDIESFRLKQEISDCRNIVFKQMNATHMSFENDSFDTIIMYNAIGHLKAVLAEVLSECQRVLRKDGYIYIISSFKMDKALIDEVFVKKLNSIDMNYDINTDKIFTYVKIRKS